MFDQISIHNEIKIVEHTKFSYKTYFQYKNSNSLNDFYIILFLEIFTVLFDLLLTKTLFGRYTHTCVHLNSADEGLVTK